MQLNFGLNWQDLYDSKKLKALHQYFLNNLKAHDADLYAEVYHRSDIPKDYLIPLAMAVETFVVELFRLESHAQETYAAHHNYRLSSHFKRNFIQRDALHVYASDAGIDGDTILGKLSTYLGQSINPSNEVHFAQLALAALSRKEHLVIDLFRQYAAWAYYSKAGQSRHRGGFLFKKPSAVDPQDRFPMEKNNGAIVSPTLSPRDGFDLTDVGIDAAHATDEAFYCIKCHDRGKDTCRTGFQNADGTFKSDTNKQPLSGCPLDQKISEMNVLFEHGQIIAALAVVTLDNPMVAATGHRICYDCSRSCIFQKQDPVDIPSIETRLLKEVLALPYGFEIYGLLTRWNPLNLHQPHPKTHSGYHVLVVGQGPSGFALAHLLMQKGHQVTAIDGLRIEPLSVELKDTSKPIKNIADYYERLSERYAIGFGGVAEYGITARWDKNFLFIIRLLLERRALYQCLDGVRFGSSITFDTAFNTYGFDHIALCLGAGSPTILPLENMTIPGVRLASDFLMALHLGDAAKLNSKTTLRIQLPVAVIGAGLTAVDTATEALAYYPVQVLQFYKRYQDIVQQHGIDKALAITQIDLDVAATFLEHGKIIYEEFCASQLENRKPNYLPHLNAWGGVTVYYRNVAQVAPSYKLNPNELKNALSEGVRFIEHAHPTKIIPDEGGRLNAVEFNIDGYSQVVEIKTLLVAAGTKPNTALSQEFPEMELDGDFFKPIQKRSFFVSATTDGRHASYLGDLHPEYSGSVVKALASAKNAAPVIHDAMLINKPQSKTFNVAEFISTVEHISINNNMIDLKIHAQAAAQSYKPGQVFKLQLYGKDYTEAIPLSPIKVDPISGDIDFRIQIVGATTRRLQMLTLKQRVFLMGPTGSKLSVPPDHRVLFVTDPAATMDITAPIRTHLLNPIHQLIAEVKSIADKDFKGFNSVFISGSVEFIEQFKTAYPALLIPCYTLVNTHLQCMMKQVCAQCIYTVTDQETGFTSIQFGCEKSIENIQRISYPFINKRNKNERLEETLLDYLSIN